MSRRVRELVGEDGEAIAAYMFEVMTDDRARTADRLEAAKWLANRGFGRAVQALDIEATPRPSVDPTKLSDAELETVIALEEV